MEQVRVLRIVVASPGDVQAERKALPDVIDEINRGVAADRNLRLELSRWETDTYPGFHADGPQGEIDKILRIDDCDLLIGIFWHRFGTATMDAASGTEHEFRLAHQAWQRSGRPQIMVYFNDKAYKPRSREETDQWGRVLEFKSNFPKEGLWWPYRGSAQLVSLVRNHLTQYVRTLHAPWILPEERQQAEDRRREEDKRRRQEERPAAPQPRRTHKVLVYVSSGSTCRDPMAKAITEQLLVGRKLKHPVDVYAVGLVPSATQASYGARQAIKEMYNADLLKDHKPTAFTDELVDKADLILVMDKKLFAATKDRLPQNKTYILKEFFGLSGDVANPWRPWGGRDPKTLERYRGCAAELKQILSTHIEPLLNALGAV